MAIQKQINFIKGEFTPQSAKELLTTLVNDKIQFHSLQNFSSEERFGRPVPGSAERIKQLEAAREDISLFVEQAAKENVTLQIESIINIAFVNHYLDKDISPNEI